MTSPNSLTLSLLHSALFLLSTILFEYPKCENVSTIDDKITFVLFKTSSLAEFEGFRLIALNLRLRTS